MLSKLIERLRNRHRWTQTELSDYTGLSISTISNIEAGLATVPEKKVEDVAKVFHIDPEEIRYDNESFRMRKNIRMIPIHPTEDKLMVTGSGDYAMKVPNAQLLSKGIYRNDILIFSKSKRVKTRDIVHVRYMGKEYLMQYTNSKKSNGVDYIVYQNDSEKSLIVDVNNDVEILGKVIRLIREF